MIQLIAKEKLKQKEFLDNCLYEIKNIIYSHQQGAIDSKGTFRIGSIVLMPITGNYPIYGLSDNALIREDNKDDFVKILKAEMRYYTAFIYQKYPSNISFSLYPSTPKVESYYLEQGYLAMKISKFDWNTYHCLL